MIGSFRLTQIGEFQPTRIGVFRPTQFGEFHPTRTVSTKQKTYSNEFKEEAVKRVMSGIPASQVARELDINVNSLYTWKQRYMKHPEQPFVGSGKLHKEDEEKRQLRQRIKELEQENEFLKKASAFFAKNLK